MSDLVKWLRDGRSFTPDWLEIKNVAAARIEELEAEVLTWRKVVQSATPGGSEYMNPERVKAHISEMREALHNARCDAVRQRRRAEAAEAKLATARNDALEEAAMEIDCGCREVCGGLDMCPKSDADAIRALKSTNQT